MHVRALVPILVAVLAAVIYYASGNTKTQWLALGAFVAAILVALSTHSGHAVTLP